MLNVHLDNLMIIVLLKHDYLVICIFSKSVSHEKGPILVVQSIRYVDKQSAWQSSLYILGQ